MVGGISVEEMLDEEFSSRVVRHEVLDIVDFAIVDDPLLVILEFLQFLVGIDLGFFFRSGCH